MGHDLIGTEHILMGLVAEGDGVAARILQSSGITLEGLRDAVEQFVGRGDQKSKPVDLPLSPRAKKVLDLAMREAKEMSVNYVGTEHILLGLISEGEGVAAQVLNAAGLDVEKIRGEVIAAVSAGEVLPPNPPPMRRRRAPRSHRGAQRRRHWTSWG